MTTAIEHCITAPTHCERCDSIAEWWPRHLEIADRWQRPIDRAIAGGFAADRAAWAFASGYQAALRAMVPDLPARCLAALCVTEQSGNRPRDIRCTIREDADGLRIDGVKQWAMIGPEPGVLLIAGVFGIGDRPVIRVVRVPGDAPGLRIESMTPTRFVPEVTHARIVLDGVRVAADALLPGDGHDCYVKPFRTIEDTHIGAAMIAMLVREGRRRDWPRDWISSALAVLAALSDVADRPAALPTTHLLLAGALDWSHALMRQASASWAATPDDPAGQRWQRDAALQDIAGAARAQRLARAWERLGQTSR